MKTKLKSSLLTFSILLTSVVARAQQSYTLKEAIDYAVKNHSNVKTAQLDVLNASAKVNEIKAMGLPQVNANIGYTNNLIIQRVFIPAKTFDPNAKEGDVVAAEFGVRNSGNAVASLSQLLFDGSYTLGLKAADVYKELSAKSLTQTKQQIAENVTKAYYGILVNEERLEILKLNMGRLDSLFNQTKALNLQGFVEKLDVQRLEVQKNNLSIEYKNVERLQELSYNLLKFQMGLPLTEPVVVTDKLSSVNLNEFLPENETPFQYGDRIEYSMLQTQDRLAQLDLKNQKAGYLPKVFLTSTYGYSTGRPQFGDLITKPWFNAATLGFSIQVPIFDGFAKKYKIIQSANAVQKIKENFTFLQNSIDLQVKQGQITLKNAYETLQEQKHNMDLAKEVVRVTKIKYEQGVGTNLELVNAESSYKEAQNNYFATLYNVLIAKVDLDKAKGKLFVE
ncbi:MULTISPECIES: TolC family protein [Bacteroidota]|jgi:outer membrane protein TolC|uniref:TolC family protein n=1 Tax=Flectobacillus rivi TaxID=2984209 RepID=A0ABT6Z0Q6_9BACT|nr:MULTISPECIES: TolC family protein [Bacteroidota]MDI9874710.1 TolC family protein [Flectobacillus rivi]